jgi:hypothetical protein
MSHAPGVGLADESKYAETSVGGKEGMSERTLRRVSHLTMTTFLSTLHKVSPSGENRSATPLSSCTRSGPAVRWGWSGLDTSHKVTESCSWVWDVTNPDAPRGPGELTTDGPAGAPGVPAQRIRAGGGLGIRRCTTSTPDGPG